MFGHTDGVGASFDSMIESVEWWQVLASAVLIVLAIGLSWWRHIGVERRIAVAAVRAAVQLIVVGYVLSWIVESSRDDLFAILWVGVMVAIATIVIYRRAPEIPGGAWLGFGVTVTTVGVCLAVMFGLQVIEYDPISFVVIAGITIGNTLPSVVLSGNRIVNVMRTERGEIEAMLALGFDAKGVVRQAGRPLARIALIPQIERTNVVGLIALPGAMTGLLLAGVDPLDAVLIQLIVMYLVLGAVATSVVATVMIGLQRIITPDLRLTQISPTPKN
jgi:putative ABC transport system permease protein